MFTTKTHPDFISIMTESKNKRSFGMKTFMKVKVSICSTKHWYSWARKLYTNNNYTHLITYVLTIIKLFMLSRLFNTSPLAYFTKWEANVSTLTHTQVLNTLIFGWHLPSLRSVVEKLLYPLGSVRNTGSISSFNSVPPRVRLVLVWMVLSGYN